MNRKHLANMRVVQKNLVYVTGLSSKLAKEELIPTLRSQEYFGQYGRISKILISKRTTASKLVMGTQESAIGVYVTYYRKEDAARAIVAIDGTKGSDGKLIRASYGTTKYCTTYLRNLPCTNPACTYLHEPGEEADSFTKEDLSTLRHAAKDSERKAQRPMLAGVGTERKDSVSSSTDLHSNSPAVSAPASTVLSSLGSAVASATGAEAEGRALPKTASWGSGGVPVKPMTNGVATPTGLREQDLPPLSVLINQNPPPPPAQKKDKRTAAQKRQAEAAAAAAAAAAAVTAAPAPASAPPPEPTPSAPAPASAPVAAVSTEPSQSSTPTGPTGSSTPKPPPGLSGPVAQLYAEGGETKASPLPAAVKLVHTASDMPRPSSAASGPPPGLSNVVNDADRSMVSNAETEVEGEENLSGYQPSSKAQALIDDLKERRRAPVQPSPFPDLDEIVLGSFAKGEFSFNLPSGLTSSEANGIGGDNALPAFSSFGVGGPGSFAAGSPFAGAVDLGLGSPLIPGTAGAPSLGSRYQGSFDPFSADDSSKASPFAAIDEMKRNLSDERGDEADSKRGSRFSFNRKRDDLSQSSIGSFSTGTLNASLQSLTSSATSNATSPALGTSPYSNLRSDSFFANGLPGQSQQQSQQMMQPSQESSDPATISRNFMSSVLGVKTDAANVQEVGTVPGNNHGRPGSSSSNSQGNYPTQRSLGPHPQQVANGTRSWQEQQAAQAQQQHTAARRAAFPQAYDQPREHHQQQQQPLLAQLMASANQRHGNNGQQQQQQQMFGQQPLQAHMANGPGMGSDLPFFDPSIMSLSRGPQQQAHLNSFRQMPNAAGAFDFHAGPPGFPHGHNPRPHDRSPFTLS